MLLRIFQISLIISTAVVFIACSGKGGTPSYNPDIGPFDEDGNYVEAWADNPPKKGSSRRSTNPKPDPKPAPKPVAQAQTVPKPAPKIASRPVPVAQPVVRPRPAPTVKPTPKPKPKPVAKPKPKPKPKPVVIKPKTIRHTVKKGDTLYGLSKRYGTSVSAIQRANGISGTTIQTGRTYIIPK